MDDIVILDRLEMLVTCDPVAELDDALADTADRLRAAQARGDTLTAQRLAAWIDQRLDERLSFRYDTNAARQLDVHGEAINPERQQHG